MARGRAAYTSRPREDHVAEADEETPSEGTDQSDRRESEYAIDIQVVIIDARLGTRDRHPSRH